MLSVSCIIPTPGRLIYMCLGSLDYIYSSIFPNSQSSIPFKLVQLSNMSWCLAEGISTLFCFEMPWLITALEYSTFSLEKSLWNSTNNILLGFSLQLYWLYKANFGRADIFLLLTQHVLEHGLYLCSVLRKEGFSYKGKNILS